jgi:RNA recognition motif-containing protein
MEFATPEVTKEVVKKMDKLEWKGRKLSVKEAADAERDKYGRIVKSDKGRTTSHRDSSTSGKGSNRVYVSNLPYEMKWQDVKDLFRDHVGEVAYVELFNDERGKPRGCGILEFDSEELAQKAIRKLNKHELRGRKMMVQEALDSERDKYGYIIKDGSGKSSV